MARRDEEKEKGRFYVSEMNELSDEAAPAALGLEVEEAVIADTEDGGIVMTLPGDEKDEAADAAKLELFDSNLAELLNENEQIAIGQELRELVEIDLESRQKWQQRMLDGLEIIGVEDVPLDAAAFEGAARVTYPGIAEAMVQFQARAMEELMPSEGPVKVGVLGKSSEKLEAQAERVQDYMNYQLTEEDDEYYNETDCMLLALPYTGSAFKKIGIDPVTGRTRSRFVTADDFIVPYFATSLKTSPRYHHRYTMPENVFKRAVAAGYFVDVDFPLGQPVSDNTSRRLADKSDDRTESYHSEDQDLTFYETTIDYKFNEFVDPFVKGKYKAPYVITFEWETNRVVRIARVWEENDPRCTKDVWFVHYKLLPSFGFYGWGYLHLIGGLGRAASGALRLLLDGSATASLQGGFKSQDAKIAGNIQFSPAEWKDVDMSAEELAKSFYSPPFKEPSPALFHTLEILINGLQRFTSTTEAMVGDAKNTGPVGTTVALIEQGSKVFSGIHRRIHAAARQEFKLIARSNYRFMENESYPFAVESGEEQAVFRNDFSPQIDVVPVSDPNIFSSTQRIALAQAGQQLVDMQPALFGEKGVRKAYRNMLKALRIPGSDDWLPEKNVRRMDPVSENQAILNQLAIQAFAEQDDEAHLAVHGAFEQELMGMDPEIQQIAIPILKAHKAEHFAQAMRKRIEQQMMQQFGVPLPPFDPQNPEDYEELPPDIEAAVARAAAGYAPPPPPPAPEQANEEQAAQAEQDRLDMAAERDEQRKDAAHVAQLKREGSISDLPDGAFGM